MKHGWLTGLTTLILGVATMATISAQDPGITFVGTGTVPGTTLDKSGLAGKRICQRDNPSVCIDQATFGGWGSAVTYTGFDELFLSTPDRGPYDGRTDVPYRDRAHVLQIKLNPRAAFPNITTKILDTTLLKDEKGQSLVGDAYEFTTDAKKTRRFDPEGLVVGPLGTFFASDEYGPYINEFLPNGYQLRQIRVPKKFLLDPVDGHQSGDVDADGNSVELQEGFNTTGRQANRGMEGLAITPNGRYLVGIMQNALLQDHALTPGTVSRTGLNNRILVIDLLTGRTYEYVYVMDLVNQGKGVNEMVALNDHEFLVLERDNRTFVPTPPATAQSEPNTKRIYKIDLAKPGLTDVSDIDALPQGALPAEIVPVDKKLFIDLLDPTYKVNATQTIKNVVAEKIEGLAWGPKLNGKPVLYVFSDNDLSPERPTQIYAFAVDTAAAGVTYRPQTVLFPAFNIFDIWKALR